MKGWIFGSPNQKVWTQKIYQQASKFQNPLHQNYKHIKTLQALLGLNEQQVYSVVVFVGDSIFKIKMPENVTHGRGYLKYIQSKTTPVLTELQVNQVMAKIQQSRLTGFKTRREHVRHVKNVMTDKQNNSTQSSEPTDV